MLKYLHIKNLILVEDAEIYFNSGLNILTGETGSGKSAILSGLSLSLGDRADSQFIRRGCEKGSVEAVFETNNPFLFDLLNEGGIESDSGKEMIIRREISLSGKGRIFINNQPAQLNFLKKIGFFLVQKVSQHANSSLLSTHFHRSTVDLFGNLHSLLSEYQHSFDKEKKLREQLEGLIQQESERLREIDRCIRELEELDSNQLKEGEDEELFHEYTTLSNSEEIINKIDEALRFFSGEKQSLLTTLNRQKNQLESIVRFDHRLNEVVEMITNAFIELQEASHSLELYRSRQQCDQERLDKVSERMSLISRLKKKYGSTIEEILNYQLKTKDKLKELENRENEMTQLETKLNEFKEDTNRIAKNLSLEREKTSSFFEVELTNQLHSLNMAQARIAIKISPQKRDREGDDHIEFFLYPNIGEHAIPLNDGASGGEISRVLLAIHTLLAGKEKRETLVFDEIDANIGGETAKIIGQKLREISKSHQVICITHFPQVASQADHHFCIAKEEREGRTYTSICELTQFTRQTELSRMSGLTIPSKK